MSKLPPRYRPLPSTARIESWARSVTEFLDVLAGRRGDPLDRAVTFRELGALPTEAGVASWQTTVSGGDAITPRNFTVSATGLLVTLQWGGYTTGSVYYAELFRAKVVGGLTPSSAAATAIGSTTSTSFILSEQPGGRYAYWVRTVSRSGASSELIGPVVVSVDYLSVDMFPPGSFSAPTFPQFNFIDVVDPADNEYRLNTVVSGSYLRVDNSRGPTKLLVGGDSVAVGGSIWIRQVGTNYIGLAPALDEAFPVTLLPGSDNATVNNGDTIQLIKIAFDTWDIIYIPSFAPAVALRVLDVAALPTTAAVEIHKITDATIADVAVVSAVGSADVRPAIVIPLADVAVVSAVGACTVGTTQPSSGGYVAGTNFIFDDPTPYATGATDFVFNNIVW